MMTFTLELLSDAFAISRLDADAPTPDWAKGEFVSITRTESELSIVCRQAGVPENITSNGGWRCLRLAGTLDFSLVGVIASLTGSLANAGISVFVVSTFNTDFVLVNERDLTKAMGALEAAGHRVGGHE